MRRPGAKILTVLTIAVGVITFILVFRYLSGKDEIAAAEPMTQVVVARARIAQGTKIGSDLVKAVQFPAKHVPGTALTEPRDAVGKFATADIWPEQMIFAGQVVSDKAGNELPYRIPEGCRAITVAVNPVSGVAGLIKPGHHVDVLVSYRASDRQDEFRVVTLLQNVLVLAVGSDMQKKDGVQLTESITLAVTPAQAQSVVLAESVGRLKLTLRGAGDGSKPALPGVDRSALQNP